MPLTNQRVADEIATLLARRRHELEGAREEIRAAEEASAAKNDELRQAAEQRNADVRTQVDNAQQQHEQQPSNAWAGQRGSGVAEMDFGFEEDAASPAPTRAPAPPSSDSENPVDATPAPPAASGRVSPRRPEPVFDEDDDDFSNQTWLR